MIANKCRTKRKALPVWQRPWPLSPSQSDGITIGTFTSENDDPAESLHGGYSNRPSAARTVLYSSIVTVIGPTPPGTGVIAAAFSATAS